MKYVIFALALTLCACGSSSKKATSEKDAKAVAGDAKAAGKEAVEKAKTAVAASAGAVTCKYDSIVRTIDIKTSGDQCTVEYTKDGSTSEIGTGSSGSTFCQELRDRVKNNLASAGYSCE